MTYRNLGNYTQTIARMDADDISLSERFEKQLQFMKKHDDITVCGTWIQTFGVSENIWKYPLSHEEIKISLLFHAALAHPSVMIKKDFFNNFQYEEQYNKAEDYALWVKAIEKQKFSNIPFPLLKYRVHTEQTDIKSQDAVADEIRLVMLKKISPDLNQDEITMYMKIISNQYVPLSSIIDIFNKLIEANKRSNFFSQLLFRRLLALEFLTSISMNTHTCLYTFYKFQNASRQKLLLFSSWTYIRTLVKCLIRYTQRDEKIKVNTK